MRATLLASVALAAAASAATVPAPPHRLYACAVPTFADAARLVALDLDVWTHRVRPGSVADVRTRGLAEERALTAALACELKVPDVYARVRERALARRFGGSGSSSTTATTPATTTTTTPTTTPSSTTTGPSTTTTTATGQPTPSTDPFFASYQSYDAIVAKLKAWAAAYPSLATYSVLGKSVEGRDIPALVITDSANVTTPVSSRRVIWWNGAQHAREWISPAVVMYNTAQLLVNAKSKEVSGYLGAAQFVITPMNNPDGYAWTMDPNGDRLWRKNRRRNSDGTYGVDLNRNWDEHWGYVGASTSTSSETYQGPAAFSEPETLATSKYILSFPNRYTGIDFHSYSQLVLRNWGWTSTKAQNEAILKELGDGIAAKIKSVNGVSFTSEPGASLYPASGCTDDWMTAVGRMAGFTIELRDTGSSGFELPESQIVPSGEEIWAAMKYFISFSLTRDIPYDTPPKS